MEKAAPCGMICSECPISQAAHDPSSAARLVAAWREGPFPTAMKEWFRCRGCWCDRALCWTEDCRIYACCVDERNLTSCADCPDFPCPDLTDWAREGEDHAAAFRRLQEKL